MLEFVFGSVVLLSVGGYLHRAKTKSDKAFKMVEKTWTDSLLSFVEQNGLSDIDIEFKTPANIKKKSNAKESIRFVATDIPKGYDFIDSSFEKGYIFASHDHKYSNEFIYVIDGELRITLYKSSNRNEEITKDLINVKVLSAGDYAFISPGEYHDFEALTDCRCICVTLPPISRGVL